MGTFSPSSVPPLLHGHRHVELINGPLERRVAPAPQARQVAAATLVLMLLQDDADQVALVELQRGTGRVPESGRAPLAIDRKTDGALAHLGRRVDEELC